MADERLLNRFLRPIYDAIDHRQYKSAIKLCQHKKIANLDLVLVLKAHCLERTGKVDEALLLCRQVQSRNPTDETLLNTMYLVFRLAGKEEEMLPTFEWACAHVKPFASEELMTSLFLCYVRQRELLKQQQTALKMFKSFVNTKYLGWACVSMVLQFQQQQRELPKGASASPQMLVLAERMLYKVLKETKAQQPQQENGEVLQLLVMILQLQQKHDVAVQMFEELAGSLDSTCDHETDQSHHDHHHHDHQQGPGCDHHHDHGHSHGHDHHDHGHDGCCSSSSSKPRALEGEGVSDEDIELGAMQTLDRIALAASLAKNAGNWLRCQQLNRQLLEDFNADDWTFLKDYILAGFELATQEESGLVHQAQQMQEFLDELHAKKENSQLRGPVLARVLVSFELLQRLQSLQSDAELVKQEEAKFVESILMYMGAFHGKACCFSDLKQFLSAFSTENTLEEPTSTQVSTEFRGQLIEKVQAMANSARTLEPCKEEESKRKEQLQKLNRRLLSIKTLRYLNAPIEGDFKTLVAQLLSEYRFCSWLNLGAKGGQREVQYTDDLLILAVHFIIDEYQQRSCAMNGAERRELLVQAASLMEYGLTQSAYNFQMKLLLCQLYAQLAAGDALLARHAGLEIKHIQFDSLSYLVLDTLLALGYYPEAKRVCESTLSVHASTRRDTPEYITRSYRLGVLSRVMDMSSFLSDKMLNSYALATSRSQMMQFQLMDAFRTNPSTSVQDLVTSESFGKSLCELEEMVSKPLSFNQHRDIMVQWSSNPLMPCGDFFAHESEGLVSCDRSFDPIHALQWLQVQVVVFKIIKSVVECKHPVATSELEALAQDFKRLVTALVAATQDLKCHLWELCVDSLDALVMVIQAGSANSNQTTWCQATKLLDKLQQHFTQLDQKLLAALCLTLSSEGNLASTPNQNVLFSVYGLGQMSVFLSQAGFWMLIFLSLAYRVGTKRKGKKDEEETHCMHSLRASLKLYQELTARLEQSIKTLQVVPADSISSAEQQEWNASLDLKDARENVLANLSMSHNTLRAKLEALLSARQNSIRALL